MTTARPSAVSRRRALSGAATVGLSLPVLAACSSDDTSDTATDTTGDSGDSGSADSGSSDSGSSSSGGLATADVPVGGGVVLSDQEVVVTQPSEGDFKAFSAVCTHTGCLVGSVTDTINCPCHGSTFDVSTGEVLGGPASSALPAVDVSVDGDQLSIG